MGSHDGTACQGWPGSQIFLESDRGGFCVLDLPLTHWVSVLSSESEMVIRACVS